MKIRILKVPKWHNDMVSQEAERAKAAFEALSPEEQAAVMQQAEQQEAMAQQAAMQEVPENNGENTIEMQADDSEAVVGQEPPMMAEGGHLYAEGSKIRKGVYKALGFHTDKEFLDWARKHKLAGDDKWSEKHGMLEGLANDDEAWKSIISHPTFIEAIKDNPALAHAIANNYDFGVYQPSSTDKATIQSISKGNWKATDGIGWFGSDDLAFKQATKGLTDDQIKALTTEQLADRMRATDAYKNTSKWLENSDNALLYLNTLLNDPNTPEVAKNHALQYVKNGKWKDGYTYNYNDVFGKVRANNPGTYWHTVMEANRGNQAKNFVIGENGQVDEIIGDVPADWTSAGNYSWATPENDVTYNYYKRPVAAVSVSPETPTTKTPEEEGPGIEPAKKADWMRYAGLFGPAVGLGMQMTGIGRPDYSDLNAAVSSAGNAHLATYKPLGNYLTYRPMDIWFEQNRMDANARATDRAIMNSASPSRMAGLIANGYNSQLASGDLYRKALEYNDAKRKDVAEFNRGTDQFNAEAFNRLSQFNASALNDAASRSTNARLHAAQQKLANDAGWYNSLYGNVSGLFKGISDLGRENAMFNVLAKQVADGVYGNTGDSYTGSIYTKRQKKKSNGGRVNKKKGLTY